MRAQIFRPVFRWTAGIAARMPKLIASAGNIVNMGSCAGVKGFRRRFAYSATKGAMLAMTKQLAIEYAGKVRVNAICPGTTETP